MTIDELVKEASRRAPDLNIEVQESILYRTGVPLTRTVVASVHPRPGGSRDASAGSHEDIVVKMSRDTVVEIVAGRTSLFWQVDPLVRALASQDVVAEVR